MIDTPRRTAFGLVPPASHESASSPVSVSVIRLVARSFVPQRRMMAFWMPIATARTPNTAYRALPCAPGCVSPATTAATPIRAASAVNPSLRPASPSCTIRPPTTAPTAKHPSATTYGGTAPRGANADTPWVPRAKASRATLPVTISTNTCPSFRKHAASSIPQTAVTA